MKTVSKKLLSLLLVAILLVSALPFQAFAADIEGMPEGGSAAGDPATPADGGSAAGDPATPADGGAEVPQEDPPVETKTPHDPSHLPNVWQNDAHDHWRICTVSGCEKEGQEVERNAHTYDANGVCTVCKYACPHTNQGPKADTAIAATCVKPGKEADTVCMDCGAVLVKGAETPATGKHNYVNGVCNGCGATENGAAFKLTLDANGGTINGGMSLSVLDVKKGSPVGTLPTPTRDGYAFAGWYVNNENLIQTGMTYSYDSDVTAYAKWTENTYTLTVRYVVNGDYNNAGTIEVVNVPAGTPLLAFLNENITKLVNTQQNLLPGYKWDGLWRDYSGKQLLIGQTDTMNQAQTMFVNFVAQSYTLYFVPGEGATVSTTSKTVYFNSPVGNLPIPTASGKVFAGWRDSNGTIYNANTVYRVAGNTTLTAVWNNEATVVLHIYINGNFSACDRMLLINDLVKNDNVNRAKVLAEVTKYYTPSYGGVLSIAGLFDENTWASYKNDTNKAGVENIQIDDSRVNKIYVMVKNANSGTILPPTNPTYPTVPSNGFWVRDLNGHMTWYPAGSSLPSGYGYWTYDANGNPIIWVMTGNYFPTYPNNSNPKTGDTAKIEIAAAAMVLAAAALITVMALRKKKSV